MLILSRKKDESIVIGDNITISVVDIKGDQVKLGIDAPNDVKVFRQEVYKQFRKKTERPQPSATYRIQFPLMIYSGRKTRDQSFLLL